MTPDEFEITRVMYAKLAAWGTTEPLTQLAAPAPALRLLEFGHFHLVS